MTPLPLPNKHLLLRRITIITAIYVGFLVCIVLPVYAINGPEESIHTYKSARTSSMTQVSYLSPSNHKVLKWKYEMYIIHNLCYSKGKFLYIDAKKSAANAANKIIEEEKDKPNRNPNMAINSSDHFRLTYDTKLKVHHSTHSDNILSRVRIVHWFEGLNSPVFIFELAWDWGNIFHWYQDIITPIFSLCHNKRINGVTVIFPNVERSQVSDYQLGWLDSALTSDTKDGFVFAFLFGSEVFSDQYAKNGLQILCFEDVLMKTPQWWYRHYVPFAYNGKQDAFNLRSSVWYYVQNHGKHVKTGFVGVQMGIPYQYYAPPEGEGEGEGEGEENTQIPMTVTLLRRTVNRIFGNEDEIVEVLKKRNLKVNIAEWNQSIPFKQQALTLRDTGILVGSHGAGLTGISLLPPDAVVIEIQPLYDPQTYEAIANDFGVTYMKLRLHRKENFEFIGPYKDHCLNSFSEFVSFSTQQCRLSRNLCIQCLLSSSILKVDISLFEQTIDQAINTIAKANEKMKVTSSAKFGVQYGV